jgi:hypothetical protein
VWDSSACVVCGRCLGLKGYGCSYAPWALQMPVCVEGGGGMLLPGVWGVLLIECVSCACVVCVAQ